MVRPKQTINGLQESFVEDKVEAVVDRESDDAVKNHARMNSQMRGMDKQILGNDKWATSIGCFIVGCFIVSQR